MSAGKQQNVCWLEPADRAKLVITENATKQLLAYRQLAFSVQTLLPCQHSLYKTLLTPSFGLQVSFRHAARTVAIFAQSDILFSLTIKTFLTCLTTHVPLPADLSERTWPGLAVLQSVKVNHQIVLSSGGNFPLMNSFFFLLSDGIFTRITFPKQLHLVDSSYCGVGWKSSCLEMS